MIFVKTFKGYEDKPLVIDERANTWIKANNVEVVDVRTALSHEQGAKHGSGDLIYTVLYKADEPIEE
ncbi:MAG: hypothetical protein KAJ01_05225 [Candidatus Hydrogenedentes bacterium]|nr:hypothetical protein [Candidatus Hydrogenedentota bacterium]